MNTLKIVISAMRADNFFNIIFKVLFLVVSLTAIFCLSYKMLH